MRRILHKAKPPCRTICRPSWIAMQRRKPFSPHSIVATVTRFFTEFTPPKKPRREPNALNSSFACLRRRKRFTPSQFLNERRIGSFTSFCAGDDNEQRIGSFMSFCAGDDTDNRIG